MPFLNKLISTGLNASDNGLLRLRVILSNLMALLSLPLLLFYVVTIYLGNHFAASMTLLLCGVSMLITILLNYKRQFTAASKLILFSLAFIIGYTICLYGKQVNIQVFIPILIVFVFIFLDKVFDRLLFTLIIVSSFLISFNYLDISAPTLLDRTFQYDYYLNMSFAILTCGVLARAVMDSLKQHHNNLNKTIAELETKNKVIASQNEEMDLFTSMASHDLKTPVRTIKSFLGLLNKEGTVTDEKSKEYLSFALSGTDQLNTLINGISAFKKTDKQNLDTSYDATNSILDKVIAMIGLSAKPEVTLTRTDLPDLKVSSVHLHHIFQNLIENAIKYNESEVKQINISYTTNTDYIIIRVDDNGIGIEEAYLEYVFEPFKKMHSVEKYQSAGLGLSICKKLMTLYQGDIKAKSNKNGTSMNLYFPIHLQN